MREESGRQSLWSVIIGVVMTAGVGTCFWFTNLDLRLQRLAFRTSEPHWPYAAQQPWALLHDCGTWPGLMLGVGAVLALALSFTRHRALRWRYPALFILLFLALGPGLVTNLFGKTLFGRPRPAEIESLGGSLPFQRAFEMGDPGNGFSFLCGHSSMGYLFLGFFFIWRGSRRWVALFAGAAFGLLLGFARVVQAAHFPSDVLLDGTLMFTVAAALSPVAGLQPSRVAAPRWKVAAITAATIVMIVGAFLFSTPVLKERSFVWVAQGETRRAATRQKVYAWCQPNTISFSVEAGNVRIAVRPQREPLIVETSVRGFGFPGAASDNRIDEARSSLVFENQLRGSFWDVHGQFRLFIDDGTRSRLFVRTDDGDIVLDTRGLTRPLKVGGSFTLVDPSRNLSPAGDHYIRNGRGDPLFISALAGRLVVR